MSREFRMSVQVSITIAALLAAAGCSNLPSAPPSADPSGAAPVAPGTAPPHAALPGPVQMAASTRVIQGNGGGEVAAGDFRVVLPPGAVSGIVAVTVIQPNVAKPFVSLEIWPPTANAFKKPVTLIANATAMNGEKLKSAYVGWFNPATGAWERVESSRVKLDDRTVVAELSHFSDYAVQVDGKAGW